MFLVFFFPLLHPYLYFNGILFGFSLLPHYFHEGWNDSRNIGSEAVLVGDGSFIDPVVIADAVNIMVQSFFLTIRMTD